MKSTPKDPVLNQSLKNVVIKRGKNKEDVLYGDVSHLNIDNYDHDQLEIISLGLGDCPYVFNIERLDPKKFTASDMLAIGSEQGINTEDFVNYVNSAVCSFGKVDVDTLVKAFKAFANNVKMISKKECGETNADVYRNNVIPFKRH